MQDSPLAAWHGSGLSPRPSLGHRQSAARLRRTPRNAVETLELPGWLQPVTTLSLVVGFLWNRTLLGIPPRGRMPSLSSWLRRMPSRPKQLSVQKLAQPSDGGTAGRGAMEAVELRPATSLFSIWEAYLFAGQFSDIPVALQLLEFPQAFLDWRRSSGLIPGMANRPVSIDPIFSRKELPDSEDEVVRTCDEMLDSYGGVLLAVDTSTGSTDALLGTLALRVKWLPQGCHIREDETGQSVVVRSVPFSRVCEASLGLEPVVYLEQFAISEAWRGSGLAQKMLREAEDLARSWGLRILTLHVQRDDWQPLRFYQKNGFEITSDWMGRGPQRFLLIKLL